MSPLIWSPCLRTGRNSRFRYCTVYTDSDSLSFYIPVLPHFMLLIRHNVQRKEHHKCQRKSPFERIGPEALCDLVTRCPTGVSPPPCHDSAILHKTARSRNSHVRIIPLGLRYKRHCPSLYWAF